MDELQLDLREAKLLMNIKEALHVEGVAGGARIQSVGLPRGTYEVALLLAVAAFQRFVTDLFLETAKRRLRLSERDFERYRRNTERLLGNPSPSNISKLFGYIGVFDVFDEKSQEDERITSRLGSIVSYRHAVVHGSALDRFDKEPLGTWSNDLYTPDPRDTTAAISEIIDFMELSAARLHLSVSSKLATLRL